MNLFIHAEAGPIDFCFKISHNKRLRWKSMLAGPPRTRPHLVERSHCCTLDLGRVRKFLHMAFTANTKTSLIGWGPNAVALHHCSLSLGSLTLKTICRRCPLLDLKKMDTNMFSLARPEWLAKSLPACPSALLSWSVEGSFKVEISWCLSQRFTGLLGRTAS